MIIFVKEKKIPIKSKSKLTFNIKSFPKEYWKYLFVIALFGIGNSSNSFLILQVKSVGASLPLTILIYAFFNLIAALSSYPAGFLSDKLGRKNLLLLSFSIFLIAYLGFALSVNIIVIGFLFILYGVYQGTFRSVGKAFAADFVPAHLRSSGIGWYSTTVGLSGLFASIIAGLLWDRIGHTAVFVYGSILSLIGIIALAVFIRKN